jgi:hypothetical protein
MTNMEGMLFTLRKGMHMQWLFNKKLWLLALPLAVFMAGCNSDDDSGGAPTDTTAPTVSSTNPGDTATGMVTNQKITAIFSEPVAPASCTTTTFTLTQVVTAVSGTVTCVDRTATFDPTSDLAASTLYTATITTGVKDLAGNALAANKLWTFTTGTTTDTAAPTVISTNPADTATGVVINGNIAATFSEAMDPATITGTTVTLNQGATPVPGTVTSLGSVATFDPTSNLAASTLYTATITTGATDLAGNVFAGTTWSFTTGAATAAGPAPVNLGTAGNFVVLAKSGISTTGTTSVVGDIGVSPIDSTAITGFGLVLDASNQFATSSLVAPPGRVYASDYAPPTPANMTTAVSAMEIAYTDAAGRTEPAPITELGAGNITTMDLAPGLYKWGTGLAIDAAGVTLTGGANDVWIFQIAQDLTVANGAIVTLSGNAQAKNIFWQVAGQATLGTTSAFKGIILSKTLIDLQTGAVMNGRALAQTAVTLDASTVTQPAP